MNTLTAAEAAAIDTSGTPLDSQLGMGTRFRTVQTELATAKTDIDALQAEKWSVGVPLTNFREVFSNDIGTLATQIGGILALNTTPILHRNNGATNKTLEIKWASGNADPITCEVPLPYDTDATSSIVVEVWAKKSATGGVARTLTMVTMFNEQSAKSSTVSTLVSTIGAKTHTITGGTVPALARKIMIELTPSAASDRAAFVTSCRVYGSKTSGRTATV